MGRLPTVVVAISIPFLFCSCSTPTHLFSPIPIRLDLFVVQNDRVHFPRTVLTGPLPGEPVTKAVIPGDPWSEAAKVIAQAVSDCFKYGYHAGEVGAVNEVGWSTTTYRLFGFQWGIGYDLERAKLMWNAYLEYLKKLPTPMPMYSPKVENYARDMQAWHGWAEKMESEGRAK
jgi:hypothetical protein